MTFGRVLLSRISLCPLACSLFLEPQASSLARADAMGEWFHRFAESEFVFQRATSNAPFQPLAYISSHYYNDTKINGADDASRTFDQITLAQGAALPFLLTERDALLVGDWVGWSRFLPDGTGGTAFDVVSIGLPVGWIRQLNEAWQLGGFVMPLGYNSSLRQSSWRWETLGGGFGRYAQTPDLWWALGLYFDVGEDDDIYLPYLGAVWAIDERWTLNALMPWPGVTYAPDKQTLFRLGASPSGTSWALRNNGQTIDYELSGWDFGISGERQVHGHLWLRLETGVGGLRGFQVRQGHWENPDFDVNGSAYISLGIDFRPDQ